MLRRPRLFLRPFELVTYGLAAAIVVYLRLSGMRLDGRSVQYMADAMLHRLPGVVLLGLALHLVAFLVTWRSPATWLREIVRPAQLLLLARVWLAAMVMTYAYSWLKVCVPLLNRRVHDEALWNLDRMLHLGVSPSIFAIELFGGSTAPWLDLWYALWLTSVLAVQSVIFLTREPGRRRNFAVACALLWLSGAILYALLPAVGPAFFVPDLFADVLQRMPYAEATQQKLWGNYLAMIAARDQGAVFQFKPFLAVAALPSLHVGAHFLFTLWCARHARRWFLPLLGATAVTFAGSLLTGFHYAVDGYAGMLIAWGAVVVADRLEPVVERSMEAATANPEQIEIATASVPRDSDAVPPSEA